MSDFSEKQNLSKCFWYTVFVCFRIPDGEKDICSLHCAYEWVKFHFFQCKLLSLTRRTRGKLNRRGEILVIRYFPTGTAEDSKIEKLIFNYVKTLELILYSLAALDQQIKDLRFRIILCHLWGILVGLRAGNSLPSLEVYINI